MAIVKYPFRTPGYSPWHELDEVSNRLARLFDDTSVRRSNGGLWSPPVTVSETADELVFTAELPGLTEDNVSIELENDVLTISGEKKQSFEKKEKNVYHVESTYGSFRRDIPLPADINADKIKAVYDKGVLTLTCPKSDKAKPVKIKING